MKLFYCILMCGSALKRMWSPVSSAKLVMWRDVSETMLSDYEDKLKCIITEDETWIYAYHPKTIDQSSEYRAKGESRPKRARQSRCGAL